MEYLTEILIYFFWSSLFYNFHSSGPNQPLLDGLKCGLIPLRLWQDYPKNNTDVSQFLILPLRLSELTQR